MSDSAQCVGRASHGLLNVVFPRHRTEGPLRTALSNFRHRGASVFAADCHRDFGIRRNLRQLRQGPDGERAVGQFLGVFDLIAFFCAVKLVVTSF